MLFNTLAYAQFFAVVFVIVWLLVVRRFAAFLPWCALLVYGTSGPFSWLAAALIVAALVVTVLVTRGPPQQPPSARASWIACAVSLGALAVLTYQRSRLDPLSAGLAVLGAPVGRSLTWSILSFAVSVGLAVLVVRARKVRVLFILGASYVFYAHWDWRFLPLIWGSSTLDWLLGNAIGRARDPRERKRWLIATVIVNLTVLGIFKYFDFGIESARVLLESMGYRPPEVVLRIALPVGISFFTFESMSYVIDVYRRDLEPHPSYVEYLCFVAFFPHLVAGPIVRPKDLLPQLGGAPHFNAAVGSEGLWLIALGLFKKVAIGDYLAVNLVDRVFDGPQNYSALECYAAVLGYAVQIYCDFSGYTDIAIGSALLLGIRFPLNFNAPYKAVNIADFWRRWHISLSTWLRDYLYIPLGGNRRGPIRTYANLLITMLLGGLWHGANWTFVVWGGLHGVMLACTRLWHDLRPERTPSKRGIFSHVVAVLLTFHFVCATWIFFRAESFQKAWIIFGQLGTLTTYHPNLPWQVVAMLALGLTSHFVPERWYDRARETFIRLPAPAQGLALFAVAASLRQLASAQTVPFVYFQF